MKSIFSHILGYLMIAAAILGLALSVVGLLGAVTLRKPIVENLTNTLNLLDDTLTATADGLVVVEQSLDQATTKIITLEETIQASGKTIQDINPMFDTLTKMISEDLPNTIAATQTSLTSAQASAALIENALTVITSLPLMPGEPYDPEVPLYEALGQVSDSLTPLTESFIDLNDSLKVGQSNLATVQTQISNVATHTGQISDELDNAQKVIEQYQSVVSRLQKSVNTTRESLPQWINMAAIFIVFFFFWLAITQIGLFTQGLERIRPAS